jgi:hypothetical protein
LVALGDTGNPGEAAEVATADRCYTGADGVIRAVNQGQYLRRNAVRHHQIRLKIEGFEGCRPDFMIATRFFLLIGGAVGFPAGLAPDQAYRSDRAVDLFIAGDF